ncbi:hypothetical protein HY486_03920 [Candidatus Woesearchaeota archaeon]|nr:hypothetical protein [Candidatus Woesearchaeota archaeon]
MEYAERILAMAKTQPLVPTQVAKALGVDSIMASAMLSELVKKGELKISSLKVGSSPLYYFPSEKSQLLNYLTYLNEKDKKTVMILKEAQILREKTQEPLIRVSLRNIKDFAIPLEVTSQEGKELWWKWYATDDKAAEELIKKQLSPQKEVIQDKPPLPVALPKKTERRKAPKTDEFDNKILNYFQNNKVKIVQKTEGGYIIEVSSSLGNLTMYCHPKNKKKLADSDISHAYVQGQIHKLNTLLLTNGECTKKAQKTIDALKGIKVIAIGS